VGVENVPDDVERPLGIQQRDLFERGTVSKAVRVGPSR
jgi:hypothetical protein